MDNVCPVECQRGFGGCPLFLPFRLIFVKKNGPTLFGYWDVSLEILLRVNNGSD
jgi:hypothetical protein